MCYCISVNPVLLTDQLEVAVITNSCCAAKPCSNQPNLTSNSSGDPEVFKDAKYVRLNMSGNVCKVMNKASGIFQLDAMVQT